MNMKKTILILTLLTVMIGVSYATDTADNTTIHTDTQSLEKSNVNIENNNIKSINKIQEKETKTSSREYDITDYNSLHEALTNDTYETVTLNINSNIKLSNNTIVNPAIKTLSINGNNNKIIGENKYQFLSILQNNVQIDNIQIEKCKSDKGGAIYALGTILTITNSKLINNTATNGGAIYIDEYMRLNIDSCVFNSNQATNNGGAIFTDKETKINITNTEFTLNKAENNGGAITINDYSTLTATKSTFNNNSAENYGGTIQVMGGSKLNLKDSTIKNNHAVFGAGIYINAKVYNSGGEGLEKNSVLFIDNSQIDNNVAENEGGAIYQIGGKLLVTNTIFYSNNAADSGAIELEKSQYSKIENNKFSGNWAWYTAGAIALSNTNYTVINNNIFNYNDAFDGAGSGEGEAGAILTTGCYNNITNNNFTANYAWIGSAIQVYSDNTIIESNYFFNNSGPSFGGCYVIYINSDNNLINNNTFKENKYTDLRIYGENNTVKNNKFLDEEVATNITLTVPKDTISQFKNVTIKGKFTNIYQNVLANTNLKLIINNENTTVKTNDKGVYTYTFNATKVGINTVTVSFAGNARYTNTSTTKKFNVTGETIITINTIPDTQYKDNITIKGKFTRKDGTPLKNTNLKLKLNNKTYTVKTNANGIYNKILKASIIGKNNVTVSFAGNNNYKASNKKTTFITAKADTKLTVNKITQKTYKDNLTVTGKFTDKNDNILKNTQIKVKINDKTYTAKTNTKGIYTVKVVAKRVGTNNITVSYAGNKNYKPASAKSTFKVVKRGTKLTVNKISATKKGNTVKITGKFTDNKGNILKNTQIKITVNTKTVNVKTNNNGIYTYSYKSIKTGKNNVTVTYPGNNNYNKTTIKTTFLVN